MPPAGAKELAITSILKWKKLIIKAPSTATHVIKHTVMLLTMSKLTNFAEYFSITDKRYNNYWEGTIVDQTWVNNYPEISFNGKCFDIPL